MNRRFLVLSATLLGLMWSCSTQKNRALNRGYHQLNAEYNVLFNGEEALKVGEQIFWETYQDNFYEILPVEPVMLRGESAESTTIIPGFARAEEKAVKTIQKHSMNIGGKQRNEVIDQAYLLLGKARYFDRRYFPALEAFNYLMKNGVDPSLYSQVRIWREKTYMRLNNNELAIDNLRSLAENLTPKSPDKSPANATLAAAHLNIAQKDSALMYIKVAAQTAYNKRLKARYFFICGQLFQQNEQSDSARWAFENIVRMNRSIPRDFWMQAKIRSLQLDPNLSTEEFQKSLEKYLKFYENRVYAHWLYTAKAERLLSEAQDSLSLIAFQQALKAPAVDSYTQQNIYRQLSDWSYDQGAYLDSGKYLDSLLALLPEDTREKRKLQRQREGMETLFQVEQTIHQTDSLLGLLAMNPKEREDYFEAYIEAQKQALIKAQEKTKKGGLSLFGNRENQFYFYNDFLKEQGQLQFVERWGNRPNIDNWRWGTSNSLKEEMTAAQEEQPTNTTVFLTLNLASLLSSVPAPEAQDSLQQLNHRARLKAAILYKEKFNDIPLSQARLEQLLEEETLPEVEVQALYHSAKNMTLMGQSDVGIRGRLKASYPDSPYTKVLLDPSLSYIEGLNTPEQKLNSLRQAFEMGDYTEMLENYEALQVFFSGSPYLSAFELLRVHIEGRLEGKDHWKKQLASFILKYPDDPLAKAMEKQLNLLNREVPVELRKLQSWKWVFPLQAAQRSQADSLSTLFRSWIAQKQLPWTLSKDVYDRETLFLVVHKIKSRQQTDSLRSYFPGTLAESLTTNNFVVLSNEYQKTLQDKTWNKSLQSTDEKQ
ncbi:MAG: hypothetical protein ACON42_09230 [Flavobacteriaceae bacterium]